MASIFTKGLSRLTALFAGLALAACATTAPEAASSAAPRPALWRLADADTTIYLFGTIHALPEGARWRTPALEQAMAASDELVTEIRLDDEQAALAEFLRLAIGQNLPPVVERVSEGKRDALRTALEGSPLPLAALDRMKTWAVAVTLTQLLFQRAGINPELGVERSITASFQQRGRTLSALETASEQFGFFNGLPEEEQRAFLEGVLQSPADVRREFDAMLRAWSAGDTRAIGRTFNASETMSETLRTVLLSGRNARWAEWLQHRLERPGTIFVAVGAGHLAGRDSVQDMLERRGLSVTRVQ
jgi:uncharacterized protein YbaP (TraB family)